MSEDPKIAKTKTPQYMMASEPSQEYHLSKEEDEAIHKALESSTKLVSEPSQEELLPCPLCGGAAELVDYGGYEILCACGINLCLQSPEKEPLIKLWNSRDDT